MRNRLIEFVVLALLAIGGYPATAAIWNWSTTPGSNASADPNINWAEGMAPSAINDSARAMMAEIAKWRRDTHGFNQTGGTSIAYTFSSSEGFSTSADMAGAKFSLYFHIANGVNPTLNIDGTGAFPIRVDTATAVPAGTLGGGSGLLNATLVFSNTSGAFILQDYYNNAYNVPLGGLLASTLTTPPNSSFVLPVGQCISTTTYNAYWVAKGSPASGVCPGGQFQIIDMRGYVPVALDNLNGTPANRLTSSFTGCGTAITSVGAVCANGIEGAAIPITQLPLITSVNAAQSISVAPFQAGRTIPTGNPGVSINSIIGSINAPAGIVLPYMTAASGGVWQGETSLVGSNSISVTSVNTANAVRPQVQPTVGVAYFLRVL